jgi:hypothetical protein
MRVKICLAVCLALVSTSPMQRVLAQGAVPSATAENPGLAALKGDDRRVVAYLVDDWGKDAANTSVDIAMNALKVRPSDETRFRIGNHIKNHPELHAILRQWGWETVVLTPDEKLVARTIVSAERDKKAPPSRADISRIVRISEKDVDRAAAMLARYEILKEDRSVGGIGYVATKPRYVNWQQWLDFQFHRVSLGSGRAFSVD